MLRPSLILILVLAFIATGCGPSTDAVNGGRTVKAPDTNQQVFQVKGVVIEVKPLEKSVKIKHEEVPDYMPAMTMPFDVKDTNELAGIEAGDPVSFRLVVAGMESWIDHIKITGPKTNLPPTTGPFRRVREVEVLNEGDLLPEYQFTNQFGKIFSTKDFKARRSQLNFYSRAVRCRTFVHFWPIVLARRRSNCSRCRIRRPTGIC